MPAGRLRLPLPAVPPGVDIEASATRPRATFDDVFLVGRPGATPETLASADWLLVNDQLTRDYRRVATSPTGLVEAWERLDPTLDARADATRGTAGPLTCRSAVDAARGAGRPY